MESSIKSIFSTLNKRIDTMSTIFSFGLDIYWRKRLTGLVAIDNNKNILDLCTGTGRFVFMLHKKLRGKEISITGVDFCKDMVEIARKRGNDKKGIIFIEDNAEKLLFPDNSFDIVTMVFGIRNIINRNEALREVKRVLKNRGMFYCLELTMPENKYFKPIYRCYLRKVIPFIGGLIIGSPIPYRYLASSIEQFYKPHEFSMLLEKAGFNDIRLKRLTMGIVCIWIARNQK